MNGHPWTAEEDALIGTDTDAAIATLLPGRSRTAVKLRRIRLGIPGRGRVKRVWTAAEIALLGTMSDPTLAAQLGCSRLTVFFERQRRKIEPFTAN
jgi:hypothetical protein